MRDPTFNSSDIGSKVIENAASINSRPLPERPLGEASHLPQMQFSDRRNQSLHGAPFTIEDGIRGVMKKQSMVIANTHSNLNLACSAKAVKQVCSWPLLSDSADCADVGVANASITNEDYIEMKQGRLNQQISSRICLGVSLSQLLFLYIIRHLGDEVAAPQRIRGGSPHFSPRSVFQLVKILERNVKGWVR